MTIKMSLDIAKGLLGEKSTSIKNCSRSIKLLTQEVFKSLEVSYVKGEKDIEHLSVCIDLLM